MIGVVSFAGFSVGNLIARVTPADMPGATRAQPSLAAELRSEIFSAALVLVAIALAIAAPHP